MSEETPKTQEEWIEHFKELAKKHGDMLAKPLVDYFADKILLTKKEVGEARQTLLGPKGGKKYGRCPHFLDCQPIPPYQSCIDAIEPYCTLCKKLTQFVKEGEDEIH